MIILEGADGTGKSTLADELCKMYDHNNRTHYSSHMPNEMLIHAQQGRLGPNEIVDRFHLSEIPYSMYYRHSEPDYRTVFDIEKECRYRNHLVILCVPNLAVSFHHWESRPEVEIVKDRKTYERIYDWYAEKMRGYCPNHITYDYTNDSLDELRSKIDAYFE